MTVKKPAVPHQNDDGQTNLELLASCIHLFNERGNYLSKDDSLILWCNAVVICLTRVEIPTDGMELSELHSRVLLVQRFLKALVENYENPQFKEDLMLNVISTFYEIISNPNVNASPIATVILSLVSEKKKLWRCQQDSAICDSNRNENTVGDYLICDRAVFSTICRWLWQTPWISHTIILSDWVMFCVKQLEASKRFDILIDVSLECLEMLFVRLDYGVFRESTFPIVYHILHSMRDTNLAFDKISRVAPQILENLVNDGIYAQTQLNPLLTVLSYIVKNNKKTALDIKKEEYEVLESYLENFIISDDVPKTLTWQSDLDDDMRGFKAGLTNLGNTCYMNSVLQALLMTKQFSRDIVLNQLKPCPVIISNLATFFSYMMYPKTRFLNPSKLAEEMLPPGFLRGQQQDSSEFLSYILEELHSAERLTSNVPQDKQVIAKADTHSTEKLMNGAPTISHYDSAIEISSQEFIKKSTPDITPCTENNSLPSTSFSNQPPICVIAPCSSTSGAESSEDNKEENPSDFEVSEVTSTTDEPSTSGYNTSTDCDVSVPHEATMSHGSSILNNTSIFHNTPIANNSSLSHSPPLALKVPTSIVESTLPRRSFRFRGKPESCNQGGPSKKRRLTDEASTRYNSVVQKSFGGVTTSEVRCLECSSQSSRLDVFRDLQLAFPDKTLDITRVQDFLDFYWSPEKMFGDNKYHCTHCEKLCNAERRSYLSEPPNNLILVLKNFKFDAKLQKQTKILQPVIIDDAIYLPMLQNGTIEYELYAAVIHSGHSTDAGHYYTVACDGSEWYKFDDECVTLYEKSDLNTLKPPFTPYILFYRLVNQELHHFPRRNEIPIQVGRYVSHK